MVAPGNPNPNVVGAQIISGEDGNTYVPAINSGPQSAVALYPVKKRGTFVLNGATPVAVDYPAMALTTVIVPSFNTLGGTQGAAPVVVSITAGVGFSVAGTASDTSTYNWIAI